MTATSDYFPTDAAGLTPACAPMIVDVADGEELTLTITPVAKKLGDDTVRMLAYNGSVPGPALRVRQGTEIVVHAVNCGDLDATVHWHGLRLDNQYDGTTETQAPIPIGGRFSYRLSFPDPGIYWYHPHIREDYGQEMGLAGTIIVAPSSPGYWPASRPRDLARARRRAPRGRPHRPFQPLHDDIRSDGPLRQRPPRQRRAEPPARRAGRAKSFAVIS